MELRRASLEDATCVAAIYRPYVEETPITFEVVAPGPEEMRARIAAHIGHLPWLVACESDTVVGYAYAAPFGTRAAYAWSVETSIYLDAAWRGRGIGRGLYAPLLELLAAQGFRQAIAGIALPNPASVALHEAMGFAQVATYHRVGWKLGAWHSVGRWQKGLGRSDDEAPDEPLALDALADGLVDTVLSPVRTLSDDPRENPVQGRVPGLDKGP